MIAQAAAALRGMLARRAELCGINRRNVELVYPHNARSDYPWADDKLRCKERLAAHGVPVPETLATCDELRAVHAVVDQLAQQEHFVIKPAGGRRGEGIVVVGPRFPTGGWQCVSGRRLSPRALARHLANIVFGAYTHDLEGRAFAERRIATHPLFRHWWPDSVCDIRIIMLKEEPVMAMVRVPTAGSGGRANLHQGGVGVAVDLATGRTTGAMHHGQRIDLHPDSRANLTGASIADWSEVLKVARRAAGAVPLGYLGVDLVLDPSRGPLVIELNVRPGLEIQNVNAMGLWRAIREAMA